MILLFFVVLIFMLNIKNRFVYVSGQKLERVTESQKRATIDDSLDQIFGWK